MSEKRYLLIPAAGVGERMKIGYPKQYFPIASGKTMLEVTVNRLSEMGFFDQIAVVVSEQDSYMSSSPSRILISINADSQATFWCFAAAARLERNLF